MGDVFLNLKKQKTSHYCNGFLLIKSW